MPKNYEFWMEMKQSILKAETAGNPIISNEQCAQNVPFISIE